MLLTTDCEVAWNSNNIRHYGSLGYKFSMKGEKFTVPIEHLPIKSMFEIQLRCDYCNKDFKRKYSDHTKIKLRDTTAKDACRNCAYSKGKETIQRKQDDHLLSTDDNHYWTFKQNRMKELDNYIKKYGTVSNLYNNDHDEGHALWVNFRNHKHSIPDAIIELGYVLDSVMPKKPIGYYDDVNQIVTRIESFIDDYGKFPNVMEIRRTLNIDTKQLTKHGGIFEIKRLMGYVDSDDLIDDTNFYNQSSYEYIVAQFLIHNSNITYLREQYPFPKHEGLYRSDFKLCLENGNDIHVEVWGNIGKNYKTTKEHKKWLYDKYNISLISIESNLFQLKMDTIQDRLCELFSPFLHLKYKRINPTLLKSASLLSDEELMSMIMEHSHDKNTLPSSKYLKEIGHYRLFNEASKRYGNYRNFAKMLGKNTIRKNHGYWDEKKIFEEFLSIAQEGIQIGNKQMRAMKNGSLERATVMFGGLLKLKLKFFDRYIQELSNIHPYEVKFLNNVVKKRGTNIMNKVTPEQQELATQILLRINQSA